MKFRPFAAVVVGGALLFAACSSDGDDAAETTATGSIEESTDEAVGQPSEEQTADDDAAETTEESTEESTDEAPADDASGGDVDEETREQTTGEAVAATTVAPPSTLPAAEQARAIVSLSPTATEMLYAIDAGESVIAVDDFSNYPPEAAEKMTGLSGLEPNVEAIAALEPDLVVTDGTNPDLLGQLDTIGIPHWEGPAAVDFDDVYEQIEQLGAATGRGAEAAELVAAMRAEIELITDEVRGDEEAGGDEQSLRYYHELDPTLYSATSQTFIGAVYGTLGLENIADAAGDGNAFPQLNAEFIIDENPDLIFLADTKCCGATADSVANRPGWDQIDAVRDGGVIEMDDDIASRWGPRIVDYMRIAAKAVINAAAPTEVG